MPYHLYLSSFQKIASLAWPIHPLFFVAIAPFLPTRFYLNRGYTVWYHYITLIYLLTKREFLREFLILQGTVITLGWYAALMNDYYLHGRFGHILYMNMPSFMKYLMVDGTGHVFYTNKSMACMVISHVLDFFFHPGIVYFLLKGHYSSGKRFEHIIQGNTMIAVFCVSRLWSMVHTYHNEKVMRGWYFGYDVYHINDLDSWLPAYIAEAIFLSILLICKMRVSRPILPSDHTCNYKNYADKKDTRKKVY